MKHITVSSTQMTKRTKLLDILGSFPMLESLQMNVAAGHETPVSNGFQGHRTLKRIDSNSSVFVEKALRSCGNLESIVLPYMVEDFDNTSRDLSTILRLGSNLKHVEIENPEFSALDAPSSVMDVPLLTLALSSLTNEALDALPQWFTQVHFRHLTNLSLDGDYLHLPRDFILSTNTSCSSLSTLKLKYCTLAPNHLIELTQMQNLKHISLGKCDAWFYSSTIPDSAPTSNVIDDADDEDLFGHHEDSSSKISYAELIFYVTSNLPNLLSLHLNQCVFNALPQTYLKQDLITPHPLQSLKVFDTTDPRISNPELYQILASFPKLKSLRLDVACDVFYDSTLFSESLPDLKTLELRGSKPYELTNYDHKPTGASNYDKLDSLSLWAAPQAFLLRFLENTAISSNLAHLCLNYMPVESSLPRFELKSLKFLEIRTIGSTANIICTRMLDSLTSSSAGLIHLELGAFKRGSSFFPISSLKTLASRCQRIKILKFTNFQLGNDAFVSHRKLKAFKLSVGGIDSAGVRVGSIVSNDSLQLAIEGLGFSGRSAVVRQSRMSDLDAYKRYK
ncbi:hypothetical protein BCR33DRAFT_715939 [Rhizoclosmatium globosum]|uniref:RNI-like protein n=1 Tax=Rhizoclosmatium globosum TaxID=329046 RepID=A0A1Y2CGF1_9FUNG|nr:hypothetical protein BCR33DRAFT_715939 [Rhizoclosmatium globosum]|eukprot:ORY45914.1 hypothetical protein BCR33DRAFT_715939 [Rhizoclosmatium globosum]